MKLVELVAKQALRQGDSGETVKLLQLALRKAGHELVADGSFGNITRTAVKRFQAVNRIAADGLVGPVTAAFLDAVRPSEAVTTPELPSVLAIAPWLAEMRALTGTKEFPGARSNPEILAWVEALGHRWPTLRPNIDWYVTDATPWCGLGTARAVGLGVPGFKPPDAPLWALNWRGSWAIKLTEPVQGCIMVKERKGGGHVTLYESEDARHFYCRGPNQNDQINVAKYSKRDGWTFHWPVGAPLPAKVGRIKRTFAGAPSNPTLA